MSTAAGFPITAQNVWKIFMEPVCFLMKIWEIIYWLLMFGGGPEVKAEMSRYTGQVRTFDITKARQRLGYESRVNMEESLRRAVN